MTLDADRYLAALESDGALVLDAARIDVTAPVPGCPGWLLADLLGHLGRVYRSVTAHVAGRATEMIPGDRIAKPPEGDAVVEFCSTGLAEVLDALRGIGVDEPVWSWSDDHTGGFYLRRMANETAVHRWDAQSAVGDPDPIEAELASDGVDEMLTVVLPFATRRWSPPLPSGSIHLHRTDGDGEWLAAFVDGVLEVRREHAKGDVAVRAGASDLVLALWERLPLEAPRFEVFGDMAVAEQWMALSR